MFDMSPLNGQWSSLDQSTWDDAFLARVGEEFPRLGEALASAPDRRTALRLMAAALAMSGLEGCDFGAPTGHLIPAVRTPENIVPGLPNYYSTASIHDGYAAGVVVKHNMGRPIKVEGNALHPASLGATDVFAQAEVLNFYDPDRSWEITAHGRPANIQSLLAQLADQRARLLERRGKGLRILTGATTSPTLAAQMSEILGTYPEARWIRWDPISRANVRNGATLAYGRPVEPVLELDKAQVVFAIDSDLLSSAPGHLRYARDFASRRNPAQTGAMSRLYAVESTPTLTGAAADHRLRAGPREIHAIVLTLANAILTNSPVPDAPQWLKRAIADLKENRGRALVHVGPDQPPQTHALAHAMNEALGARGNALELIEPVCLAADDPTALNELVKEMDAGHVGALLIVDSNPAYAASGALAFAQALKRVEFSLALSATPNETTEQCVWAVPMTHPWETWSDARAYDGAATILQPNALPLYGATGPHEMLSLLTRAEPVAAFDLVQSTWRKRHAAEFAGLWRRALAAGVVPGAESPKSRAVLRSEAGRLRPPEPPDHALYVMMRPDPHLWDGRHANNPWLQELPRPFTKLTWDNPILVAPERARKLDLKNGDLVRLAIGDVHVDAPVWVMPGQAADCVVAYLGFGRRHVGGVGAGAGFDFYPLLDRDGPPTITPVAGRAQLASTERHSLILDTARRYVRHGDLADYERDSRFLQDREEAPHLYRWKPDGPAAWAMSVDLNACIGCNACAIACQAENNVPVVGKEQVLLQREMHWLRIDRYFEGQPDEPRIFFQPVLCMHCEQAPCEPVCPVGATMHDSEGLNVMVYNRCVGTRFCSNNCPYKVRRFNYLSFAREETRPPEARNPEVTVRARGVMEKCTFCLQRIAEERIAADRDNRPVGEVRTACQAACPTQALTFGNLAAPESEVAKRKQSPLTYALLGDQNTQPRVTYEARIRNPNPLIEEQDG